MSNYGYFGGCREGFLYSGATYPKRYLHPVENGAYRFSAPYLSGEEKKRKEFAITLYKRFFQRIPVFAKHFNLDAKGLFIRSAGANPYAHLFLGFVKSYRRLLRDFGAPSLWDRETFIKALKRTNGSREGMVEKFYFLCNEGRTDSRPSTDASAAYMRNTKKVLYIPHDIKLSSEFWATKNVKFRKKNLRRSKVRVF